MNTPTHTRYPTPLILMHWLVALLVLTVYLTGDHPTRDGIIGEIHVAGGILIAMLLCLRLPMRLFYHRQILQHAGATWQQLTAKLVQFALYGAMLLVPLTGWLAISSETTQFSVLGWQIPLMMFGSEAEWVEEIGDVHEFCANAFIGLAGFHAVVALVHHFVWKDGVLRSMSLFYKNNINQ